MGHLTPEALLHPAVHRFKHFLVSYVRKQPMIRTCDLAVLTLGLPQLPEEGTTPFRWHHPIVRSMNEEKRYRHTRCVRLHTVNRSGYLGGQSRRATAVEERVCKDGLNHRRIPGETGKVHSHVHGEA